MDTWNEKQCAWKLWKTNKPTQPNINQTKRNHFRQPVSQAAGHCKRPNNYCVGRLIAFSWGCRLVLLCVTRVLNVEKIKAENNDFFPFPPFFIRLHYTNKNNCLQQIHTELCVTPIHPSIHASIHPSIHPCIHPSSRLLVKLLARLG